MQKFQTPVQGVPEFIFFYQLLFQFVVSNPFNVLDVEKKTKSFFFSIYHPSLF